MNTNVDLKEESSGLLEPPPHEERDIKLYYRLPATSENHNFNVDSKNDFTTIQC